MAKLNQAETDALIAEKDALIAENERIKGELSKLTEEIKARPTAGPIFDPEAFRKLVTPCLAQIPDVKSPGGFRDYELAIPCAKLEAIGIKPTGKLRTETALVSLWSNLGYKAVIPSTFVLTEIKDPDGNPLYLEVTRFLGGIPRKGRKPSK